MLQAWREIASLAVGKFLSRSRLPVSVVSTHPFILASFSFDAWKHREAIAPAIPRDKPCHLLLQLGWECETPERVEDETRYVREILEAMPSVTPVYLANSDRERENLAGKGIKAIFCNHNAFLDERKYSIVRCEKTYDAVHVARITPFKRHELSRKIQRLLIIGAYQPSEEAYAKATMQGLTHATWIPKVHTFSISRYMASAHAGLCLSESEGAMFVSAEYLLCGLPVVSTPSLGGRDAFFSEESVTIVPPEEDAVAEAVNAYAASAPDAERIRADVIEKLKLHRERYFQLIASIAAEQGVAMSEEALRKTFFHKLALRTVPSWQDAFRVLKGSPSVAA